MMKKSMMLLASLAIFGVFQSQAIAAGYVTGGLMKLDTEMESLDADLTALSVAIGNEISPGVAIEGMLAIGLGDDSLVNLTDPLSGDSVKIDIELKNILGVAAVFSSNFGSGEVYAKVGFASIEYDFDASLSSGGFSLSGSTSEDDTGLMYGFGMAMGSGSGGQFVIEYLQLPDVDFEDTEVESTSLGIAYRGKI